VTEQTLRAPGHDRAEEPSSLHLEDGSRVAVIGSGPAGSLFAYFLLEMAGRVDLRLEVDLWEPRGTFSVPGPQGCNMCGGIVSETLVQNLATEGMTLSPGVIQRGIDSYVLHTDVGTARIATPLAEMRIGAMHRGAGPKDAKDPRWESFDHHLQERALAAGANLLTARVEKVSREEDGRVRVEGKGRAAVTYDLVAVAVGVNSPLLKQFEELGIGFERPKVTKTAIREYHLGEEVIGRTLGSSMHVFLLDVPRLEFAAAIPKGDYVTVAILGEEIDNELVDGFLARPEVKACFPPGWDPEAKSCACMPNIAVQGVAKPYADRLVFIGDAGVTRLYKDGIGAAYRTAKAAARAAVFQGVSEAAFERRFMPVCRSIASDNRIGKIAFLATRIARGFRLLRRAMLGMTIAEQPRPAGERWMSLVLWDMFSGSAPYRDIFLRMLRPAFLLRFVWCAVRSLWRRPARGVEVVP
jgi:flavin-dependent dehydrogenase